jgi:ferrous-iron efflux pump FieF
MSRTQDAYRLNLSAGALSVSVALALVGLKLWALFATGALSIAATLADSMLDVLMSAAGLLAIRYAAKPADEDHAFGHTSAEDLATLAQSVFILVSAGIIAGLAGLRLWQGGPQPITAEATGLTVIGLSIALTAGLILWQRRVVRMTGNRVVAADSLHYVGDLVPNIGAVVALWASAQFGLTQVDAVVALLAAGWLIFSALRLWRHAWDALMDRRADPAVIAGISAIAARHPGVLGFHDLKTRMAGSRIFVNLHIELDGQQSLTDAHAIGAALRRAILAAYPQADVLIHKDPVGEGGPVCPTKKGQSGRE